VCHVAAGSSGQAREQINSLLLELIPDFCESIKPYFIEGTSRRRASQTRIRPA
jgi:hypothetical protein